MSLLQRSILYIIYMYISQILTYTVYIAVYMNQFGTDRPAAVDRSLPRFCRGGPLSPHSFRKKKEISQKKKKNYFHFLGF